MMSAVFDPIIGVPDFTVADSRLQMAETEEVKEAIEESIRNKAATGFVESRPRERPIDPNTGMPVGMTEKQIEDKLIKDKQKEELEAAMESDRLKIEMAKFQKEEAGRQRKEKEQKQKEEQEEEKKREVIVTKIKKNLPDEPEEDNKEAATIQFRLPDGSQTIQRRFLKTDKIQTLYDYIYSLGKEKGFETGAHEFDLIQNFPRKIYGNMDKTIADEGLHPRSKLYIKEHEEQ
jgi:hypothetical protein